MNLFPRMLLAGTPFDLVNVTYDIRFHFSLYYETKPHNDAIGDA